MKNKGFTLIELLAVIVILAIIALIAVPIILNIIDDAKKESDERSVELYASAIKNGIAAHQLRTGNEVPAGTYELLENGKELKKTDGTETFKIDYDGNIECALTEIRENGTILLEGCTVNGGEATYDYGEKQGDTSSEVGKLNSVCEPAEDQIYTTNPLEPGYKYDCYVDPLKEEPYSFYVLKEPTDGDTTINLIMDRNICEDGTPTEEGKTCNVEYNSSGDAEGVGPVTAMTYLNNATSSWKKVDNLNITYDDEGENFTGFVLNGKARLPYKNEVSNSRGSNNYLYDNLDFSEWEGSGTQPTNSISRIYGYWTLSTSKYIPQQAWSVWSKGELYDMDGVSSRSFGVRPVITLSI